MDLKIDPEQQKYLFFDMGHDTIKIGNFHKNIVKPYDYLMIPTQLFPHMQEELWTSNFHKTSIEIETLKLLNGPKREELEKIKEETKPFLADGIIRDRKMMEKLLDLTVQKILLDPLKFKTKIDVQELHEGVDPEQLAGINNGK